MTGPLHDRVCLVTGASSGIGLEIAAELARRGATVLAGAPNADEAARAAAALAERAPGERVTALAADLSTRAGVQDLARQVLQQHDRLDVLVNNAGVYLERRRVTADGFEATLAINGLAPFALTARLLPALRRSGDARVVNISSIAHQAGRLDFDDPHFERRRYHGLFAYAASKLSVLWFTRELARRERGAITCVAAHPGIASTALVRQAGLFGRMFGWATPLVMRSPGRAARTPIHLATAADLRDDTGGYFVDERPRRPSAAARDDELAARWWTLARQLSESVDA